jgi:hypothetical protein
MTSADPVVGDPLNGQTWNRYSYVYNNPLAYTDPTGFCPICLGEALSRIGNGIQKILQRDPIVGQALVIASAAICYGTGGGCALRRHCRHHRHHVRRHRPDHRATRPGAQGRSDQRGDPRRRTSPSER